MRDVRTPKDGKRRYVSGNHMSLCIRRNACQPAHICIHKSNVQPVNSITAHRVETFCSSHESWAMTMQCSGGLRKKTNAPNYHNSITYGTTYSESEHDGLMYNPALIRRTCSYLRAEGTHGDPHVRGSVSLTGVDASSARRRHLLYLIDTVADTCLVLVRYVCRSTAHYCHEHLTQTMRLQQLPRRWPSSEEMRP